jgi:hypothetical protein
MFSGYEIIFSLTNHIAKMFSLLLARTNSPIVENVLYTCSEVYVKKAHSQNM